MVQNARALAQSDVAGATSRFPAAALFPVEPALPAPAPAIAAPIHLDLPEADADISDVSLLMRWPLVAVAGGLALTLAWMGFLFVQMGRLIGLV